MASAPEDIMLIWGRLRGKTGSIPAEFWEAWGAHAPILDEIDALAAGGEVPVERVRLVAAMGVKLQRFIRSIRASSDGVRAAADGGIFLPSDAAELVAHHVGNDLYVIALLADVPRSNPQPLASCDAAHILERTRAIREFFVKLKDWTA